MSRRTEPRDDVTTKCRADVDGQRLTPRQLAGHGPQLVTGGPHGTTSQLLGNLTAPDLHSSRPRDRLTIRRRGVATRLEESLRLATR